jgi:hypothetical protein
MISRCPNIRASSEKAPGPVRISATVTVSIKSSDRVVSNKLDEGVRNHEKATLKLHNPAALQASGVKSPIRIEAPLTTAATPTIHVQSVRGSLSVRQTPP